MRSRLIAATLMIVALTPAAARPPSLDRALAGRTAGKPTSCITNSFIDGTTIFDSGAILYRMSGGPDYLNTPASCPALRSDRAIVTHVFGGSLCRGDVIQVIDPPSPVGYGSCILGDFVPYSRPKKHQ